MTTTEEMLHSEFEKLELTDDDCNDMMYTIAMSIPAQIPFRMKMALAVSEIITWASMFRIHIRHWNRSIIPVNAISFIVAKSGYSKDSSMRAVRTCFEAGYDEIRKAQHEQAKENAIAIAEENDDADNWIRYYVKPNPLFVAISTPEGMIQHLADMQKLKLGAGYIADSEFAQSLQSTANLAEIFKQVSIAYDLGNIDQKMLKDKGHQTSEIRQMPMSMMMISSPDLVIYDSDIKRKFKLEFTSKLARRSFLTFANEKVWEPEFDTLSKLLEHEKKLEDIAIKASDDASRYIKKASEKLVKTMIRSLSVDDSVRDMFIFYKKYNEHMAESVDMKYPITRLTRAHMQWKALKLSGALAILDMSTIIKTRHYRSAMWFTELISKDVYNFEVEMQKEGYELFVDYIHNNSVKGRSEASIHTMRKMGFISSGAKTISSQLNEITLYCNSYDNTGIYEAVQDKIIWNENKVDENCLVSYVDVYGDKKQRGAMSARGYECEELRFCDLANVLKADLAYSNFRFKDGEHKLENISSGCKWIVLDIDDTMTTDEECHELLMGINHHIARTSNPDVATKYRILLELEYSVNISSENWTQFIRNIANDLSLNADIKGKSQIFFSYSGRNVMSCTNGTKINPKVYMKYEKPVEKKKISANTRSQLLKVPMETFEKAFNAMPGRRATSMFWAVRYAKELGGDIEYCRKLVNDIQEYWIDKLPEKQINGLFKQMERWEW